MYQSVTQSYTYMKGLLCVHYSRGVVGMNLVLSDKVFFSVDSGSLGHA